MSLLFTSYESGSQLRNRPCPMTNLAQDLGVSGESGQVRIKECLLNLLDNSVDCQLNCTLAYMRVPSKLIDAKSAFTELGQYSGAERRAF